MPCHPLDVDAVENRGTLFPLRSGDGSGLPPILAFLQNCKCMRTHGFILRCIGYLLVATKHNDAHPLVVTGQFIDLETDERI